MAHIHTGLTCSRPEYAFDLPQDFKLLPIHQIVLSLNAKINFENEYSKLKELKINNIAQKKQ